MATGRRGFLAAGLAMLPGGAVAGEDQLVLAGRRLARLHGETASARHVAATYLAGIGAADWRGAALALDMPAVLAPAAGLAGAELRAWLGARIRADFAAGAVLDVDGWQLSRAEVGACLLVAGDARSVPLRPTPLL